MLRSLIKVITLVIASALLITGCNKSSRGMSGGHTFKGTPACRNNHFLQKYGCSLDRIESAAQDGDPDAQYALGYMYFYGIGTVRDVNAAKLWIRRAAAQGQPLALRATHILNHDEYPGTGGTYPANYNPKHYTKHSSHDFNSAPKTGVMKDHLPAYSVKKADNPNKKRPVLKVLQKKEAPAPAPAPASKVIKQTEPAISKDTVNESKLHKPLGKKSSHAQAKPVSSVKATSKPQAAKAESKITATSKPQQAAAAKKPMAAAKPQVRADNYTIQLMSGSSLASLAGFVNKHHLQASTSYYATDIKGKPYYKLLYGKYKSRAQANNALKTLPSGLQSLHPWVKSYHAIKGEMKHT